jgi:hypothetical protein
MVFGLGPFEQMELDEPRNAIQIMNHIIHTFSKAPSAPLFSRARSQVERHRECEINLEPFTLH